MTATATIHRSKVGTYHPGLAPVSHGPAWTINDTRGYTDGGPACDECGACECDGLDKEGTPACSDEQNECIGLSFAFVCLDGGESLCEECAQKEGIAIVDCDCE